jgi:phosphatidate cytidylyltransferase
MSRRVLTIAVGLPLFLLLLWRGGMPWTLLLGLLAVGGAYEWVQLSRAAGALPAPAVALGGTALLFAAAARRPELVGPALLAVTVAALLVQLLPAYRRHALANAGATVLGALYPALFVTLDLLRAPSSGYAYTLLVVVAVWASDGAAMIGGRSFGRHTLAPALSPKKTWEGAVSGLGGAVAGALAVGWLLDLPLGVAAAAGVVVAVAGLLGDLAESALKRSAGVKDTGTLLPGHGGILDRFDAMLFAAPAVYLLLRWVIP